MHVPTGALSPRQKRLLARLEDAHSEMLDVIAGLDETTLCSQPVTGRWTVRDILVHIIAWNEEFRTDIELILKNEHPGTVRLISGEDDFAAWNQEQIAARSTWSWTRVLENLESDHENERMLIQRLSPVEFRQRGVTPWKKAALKKPAVLSAADTESVETLVTYHWRHINQHVAVIRQWREQRMI